MTELCYCERSETINNGLPRRLWLLAMTASVVRFCRVKPDNDRALLLRTWRNSKQWIATSPLAPRNDGVGCTFLSGQARKLQKVCFHFAFSFNFNFNSFAIKELIHCLQEGAVSYVNLHWFSGTLHSACNVYGVAPDVVNKF